MSSIIPQTILNFKSLLENSLQNLLQTIHGKGLVGLLRDVFDKMSLYQRVGLALLTPVLLLSIVLIYRILACFVRYKWQSRRFRGVWRHPLTAPGIFEATSRDGKMDNIWPPLIKPDGSFVKVSNWGPHLNGSVLMVLSDKDVAQMILSAKEGEFPKANFLYELFTVMIGSGLVISEGEMWKKDRKLLTPFFHFRAIQDSFPIMIDSAKAFLERVERHSEWIPAKDTFATYTSSVILKFGFGDAFEMKTVNDMIKEMNLVFNDYFLGKMLFGCIWDYLPFKSGMGMHMIKKRFLNFALPIIRKVKASPNQTPDMLSFLCHSKYDDGSEISEAHIADQCLTFLFAGEDTSSCTLSWVMYYLSLNPHVQNKLQEEVDNVLNGEFPTPENIKELKYCSNVIKETLRIRPVVPWITRQTHTDLIVDGVLLPKGTTTSILIYALHHDTRYWDQPYMFIPERWEEEKTKKSFIWVPFSAGQRNCIGQKFATQEMIVLLSMIAQRFNVKHNPDKTVFPAFEGVVTPINLEIQFSPRKRV